MLPFLFIYSIYHSRERGRTTLLEGETLINTTK
uniref:Uncharacterized protein n=1 Tax=Arundo donax TaxID=35708 RepID=A0A0A8Y974_ARUDO